MLVYIREGAFEGGDSSVWKEGKRDDDSTRRETEHKLHITFLNFLGCIFQLFSNRSFFFKMRCDTLFSRY